MSNYKKLFVGLMVVAMVFSASALSAKALTQADVDAICVVLSCTQTQRATLMAVAAGSTGTTVSSAPIPPLTMGSSGAEVTKLQNFLMGKGFSIPAGATGYFGSQTQAALVAFQTTNNIMPAAGYYGSITAGVVSNMLGGTGMPPVTGGFPAGCTSSSGFSTTTGMPCAGGSNLPAGCTSTAGFSPTTGMSCSGGSTPNPSGPLAGGAGSLSYSTISGLTNEEVGEDSEDVPVAGMELEADEDSDIMVTAVKLVFNEGTANQDFDEYASEVSIWLDDEVFARVDANEFTDESGTANDWTKTVTLDNGAIIRAGETGDLEVRVSGVSNLDSADAADTWTIDFTSVRFVDGTGVSTSEDPTFTAVTFSFDTFATATDLEMKTNLTTDNPDEGIVVVDADGQDITLIEFKIVADGSDLLVKEIPVALTGAGLNHIDHVTDELVLEWDGNDSSESIPTSSGTTETVTFDDLDIEIADGDTVVFTVIAKTATSSVTNADSVTLQGTITPDNIIAEDNAGEDVTDGDSTGSATGETQHVFSIAPVITIVGTPDVEPLDNGTAAPEAAEATIKFSITAEGGTIYLNGDNESTENKRFFVGQVYGSGNTASTTASTTVFTLGGQYTVTNSGSDNEYYTLNEGDTMTIEVDATVSQNTVTTTAVSAGLRALLLQYGTDSTSDTTRSAIDLNWTDLTDQTQTGTTPLVNAS